MKLSFCLAVMMASSCCVSKGLASDVRLNAGVLIEHASAIVRGNYVIPDASGTGAVRIRGDNITVDFQGAQLDGAQPGQTPDQYTGTGILIEGRNITLKNAKVRGYKVGIHAVRCPGLTIEDTDISGNYRKHLLSTPEAEDESDWIFGHNNDEHEWLKEYGMGLYIEKSDHVTVRRVKARRGQNGIGIDRVAQSRFYDNDCSFLSGWGFSMWRSDSNVISRNAFDFCIRGYSHGVYNRGQDSAGIFIFEQNSGNVIAENSVTHGGDGLFGFAGLEALGDNKAPAGYNYKRAGNNDNIIVGNDFSYAAAHGIEMTFSFGNYYLDNRIVGNSICGFWGGLSQDTIVAGNHFEANGGAGYGLERGGVNIDSGRNNRIVANTFSGNRCAIHLWGPPSVDFMKKPWAIANQPASRDNTIASNSFNGDNLVLHLRGVNENTIYSGNRVKNVGKEHETSKGTVIVDNPGNKADWSRPSYTVFGETKPVGARKQLAGRQNIIMTEWEPYDFEGPAVCPSKLAGASKTSFRILGPGGEFTLGDIAGDVTISPKNGSVPAVVTVSSDAPGLHSFSARIAVGGTNLNVVGVLMNIPWEVKFFRWDAKEDPRENVSNWSKITGRAPVRILATNNIDFKWGTGAPSDKVGADHFATISTSTIELKAGKYRIRSVSDDGIRVSIDGQKVIDDWTWHAPKANDAEIKLTGGKHELRIEHFEIDGFAQLQLRVEPLD